jgi:ligand-binding SRPBCC domain-containing protein
LVRDRIEYEIGFGFLDTLLNVLVSRQLRATFRYRQGALERLLITA